MRLRNQVAAAVVTAAITLPFTSVSAKNTVPTHRPSAQLVKVGAYPTQVTATVRSLRNLTVSTTNELGLRDQIICVIKLRIHRTKALTGQGTTINDNESMEVVSAKPIDKSLIGKTVKARVEMRADSTSERWLLTEVVARQ